LRRLTSSYGTTKPWSVRGSQRVLNDPTSYDTVNPEGNTPTLHLCHH
jgi:hypothetical protein